MDGKMGGEMASTSHLLHRRLWTHINVAMQTALRSHSDHMTQQFHS